MCAIAGLKAALEWIETQGLDKIHAYQMQLHQRLYEGLVALPQVKIYEISSPLSTATLSFNIEGLSPSQVGLRLDREFGILTRVGLHCSPLTHKSIGSFEKGGSVRMSIGAFNTFEEITQTIKAVEIIARSC